MRSLTTTAVACFLLAGLGAPAHAAPPEGWHKNVDEGLEASAKSGKPLLVITAWARKL